MSHFQFMNQVETARTQGLARAKNHRGAFIILNNMLRAASFKYHFNSDLEKFGPKIKSLQQRNWGVLVYVRINQCDSGLATYGGMKIMGAGKTPWEANKQDQQSLWASCGRAASLFLWFTPLGMSVESPETIRESRMQPIYEEMHRRLLDSINPTDDGCYL